MYIVQFTVGDVPMGEVVAGEKQMEREPHEVLHDFLLYFVFYMKFYIFSLISKTSNFNVCTCIVYRFPMLRRIARGLRLCWERHYIHLYLMDDF